MLNCILAISVSFIISLFLTPFMIVVAKKKNIVDIPDQRKDHKIPTPLLGGIAICVATVISIILFAESTVSFVIPIIIVAAVGVSFMGLIDDILSLSAKRRLVILFILSLIVFFGFVQFYFNDGKTILQNHAFLNVLFSVFVIFWIVGVTNAINFSDGLDGLASYLSLASIMAFAVIFSIQGRDTLALPITLALFGAIAGFIPYNRNPALIFMGDAGSMFIGFMLSLLSIACISQEDSLLSTIVPIYILFVPILDMCMSILRRIIIKKPIMEPDKMHFHHILIQRFENRIFVVIILSSVQIAFAALGIIVFITKLFVLGWILIGLLILCFSIYTILSSQKIKKLTS